MAIGCVGKGQTVSMADEVRYAVLVGVGRRLTLPKGDTGRHPRALSTPAGTLFTLTRRHASYTLLGWISTQILPVLTSVAVKVDSTCQDN